MNSTTRFSNRVANYVKYRPGYPPGIISTLVNECGLSADSVVADLGSGTGILSHLLLPTSARIIGVEPNREMREAGDSFLAHQAKFSSINGTAEATTLPDHSIDIITAAQAFHWFNPPPTRREFVRILKPNGWVAIIWNNRFTDTTPFLIDYEQMLKRFSPDYGAVVERNITHEGLTAFYAPQQFTERTFPNRQEFDFEGLRGRLLSSSYAPEKGQPGHEEMLAELREIFDRHNLAGRIAFDYTAHIYYGHLA